jgi:glutathione S-transferase
MTKLVLYGNTPLTSPYVLSVYVALEEKKLPFDFKLWNLEAKEHHDPGFVQHSITGRVPTLQHGDFWIAESTAITEYLDEAFPAPEYVRLYPADLRERARARMVQDLVRSDFLDLRIERPTESFFQGARIEPMSDKAKRAASRLIRIAEQLLDGRSTVASHFTLADVDLATMLMRLVKNGEATPPALVSYAERIYQRPSIRKWLAQTSYKD